MASDRPGTWYVRAVGLGDLQGPCDRSWRPARIGRPILVVVLHITAGIGGLVLRVADDSSMKPVKQHPGTLLCIVYVLFAALWYLSPLLAAWFDATH